MTNHDNTATCCEIRNCVDILWGMVSYTVSTLSPYMDFDETVIVLVYAVGGYWIITYVKHVTIHHKAQCFIWK